MEQKVKYAVYTRKGKEVLRDTVWGRKAVATIIQLREEQGYEYVEVKRVSHN